MIKKQVAFIFLTQCNILFCLYFPTNTAAHVLSGTRSDSGLVSNDTMGTLFKSYIFGFSIVILVFYIKLDFAIGIQ